MVVENRKVLRVFLASPGDLAEERRLAKAVVDDINDCWASELGYQVQLIGWEDTVSVFGRPQSIINQDLERCELFIGMLYKRWGTPPSSEGPYTSGFEEEFEISVRNHRKVGRPQISLFFKLVDDDQLRDPGEELKKVLAFKQKIQDERLVLYEQFSDLVECERKLRRCISRYLLRVREADSKRLTDDQSPTTERHNLPKADSLTISNEVFESLSSMAEATTSHKDDGLGIPAEQIARLRLLASVLSDPRQNDENFLGVHDANLLYLKGNELNLTSPEKDGLVDAALFHLEAENVPLWHWLARLPDRKTHLALAAMFGDADKRIGALAILRLTGTQLQENSTPKRSLFVGLLLTEETPPAVRVATLEYLGTCGTLADIEIIKSELERANHQTSAPAEDAAIRIALRDSRQTAFDLACRLKPRVISQKLLDELFSESNLISTSSLLNGLENPIDRIKRECVSILARRGALSSKIAEKLVTDIDPEIRYHALQVLAKHRQISEAEARQVLIKQRVRAGLGLLTPFDKAYEGHEVFDRFRRQMLVEMPIRDLERLALQPNVFDCLPRLVLFERRFRKYAGRLRAAIADKFKKEFDEDLQKWTGTTLVDTDVIDRAKSLENFLRKERTRAGLSVLVSKGGRQDLVIVRDCLASGFIDTEVSDLECLAKFGEWKDVGLILSLVESRRPRPLLIDTIPIDQSLCAAQAIYALGRERVPELLQANMPGVILQEVIKLIPDKTFAMLPDAVLLSLLSSDAAQVRKVTALRCVRVFSKAKLRDLLNEYHKMSTRYYNVYHWLDLGISLPQIDARTISGKCLSA